MPLLFLLVFAFACNEETESDASEDQNASATAATQGYGGEIAVTVTVADTVIEDVTIEAERETEGIGSNAIEQLPDIIVEANSFDVDVISGATITSQAILTAGNQAYAEAIGETAEEAAEIEMRPGVYTGEGSGYYVAEPIEVEVEVDESSILSIEVSMENGETKPILQSVIDKMIPRMIEHQSVSVEAISGATSSSNGVRQAVTEAITTALEEGGNDPSLVSSFQIIPDIQPGEEETIETNVLVVGMGGAGTAAAIRAAQVMSESEASEVNVLAIDKAGKYGGTSANTTGMMAINPTRFSEEHNDGNDFMDKEALREAWLDYTEGDAKTELVDLMLDHSGDTLDWLVYDLGFQFETTPNRGFSPSDIYDCWFAYDPYNGHNFAEIGEYYDSAYSKYEEFGGEYMLETEAYGLIYDTDENIVKGVKARSLVDGTEYEILADVVIMATGGFGSNTDMQKEYFQNTYYPLQGEWQMLGMKQNDGKLVQSAIDVGAGTYNISMPPMVHLAGTPTIADFDVNFVEEEISRISGRTAAWSVGDLPMHMGITPDSLAVDTEGQRFTSEAGVAMLDPWIAGPYFYSIWSDDRVQSIKENGLDIQLAGASVGFLGHNYPIPAETPLPEAEEVLQAGIDNGFVYRADTIEELAREIGVNENTLLATVETYNEYSETGIDEQFGKDAELLKPVEEGPYYAVKVSSYIYGTTGGVDIDENLNVLQADTSEPISNLYAVGTDSMGVLFTEQKAYVTYGAAAQGWVYTSGYLAGESAAEKILSGN